MEQAEVKYAPGMRIIVRGEEWMVKKVETNSLGNQTLYVIGLSQLVKDYESMFLVDVENDIEIVDPAKVTLVPDDSAFFRKSKVYIESQWRSKIPTDNKIHIGNKAAMDLMSYQLEPAQMALNKTRQRILIADTVGLGKTLEAGILMSELIARGKGKRILVVTVKSMMTQFQKEMWNRFTIPLVRLDSSRIQSVRAKLPTNYNPFFYYDKTIISVDTLKNDLDYRTHLENAWWDIIVIDEAHNVAKRGDRSSQRSKLASLLANRSDTLIMLTATPHDGKGQSVASLMNMLDPTAIADEENYTNRMIEECMAGNIDMIITKSISRFARNTLDCLKYIRQLKDKNIAVFFEKENINTMDSKGEVLLTIMASLAQQESQSLSQNVKLGIQYRYQQGEVQVNHKRFLGYTKDENKQLVIDPEGAKVVKRIYREYLEGASLLQIARGLEADGILTAAGKAKWRPETLKKILQNEKYIGDALLQKTYTVDFLSKKRVKNNGIVPQYYVENSHEPIIPRELFMQVQEEMVRRANIRGGKGGKKRVYSSKYALSSIVYCGQCGDIYRRVHWNNRGYKSIVWRCVSRLEEKGSECTAPTINEETLQAAVVKAINELLTNKEPFLSTLQKNIATVLNEENDNTTDDIDRRLEELQQQLLIQAKSKNDYEDVADEIYRLRELKQNALVENADREGKRQRIAEMTDFLNKQSRELEEYDEQLVRRLIEKVTIYEAKLTVEFKSGIEIDEEI